MTLPLVCSRLPGYFASLFPALMLLLSLSPSQAEEIKVEAKLVWGTNGDGSNNPAHKPLDQDTAEMLRKIFKWKNYYLETLLTETIPSRKTVTLKMSKDCTVEITELPGSPVEVKLIGKGKLVNKTKESFNRDKFIVIGSDDTGECAWFVVLKRLQ